MISNISIEQIFKITRTNVLNDTNNKQVTWEESSLHGDEFSFIEEDEVLIEFQPIINEFIVSDKNILLQNIFPYIQPKYFHSLSIENLHLALSFNIMAFEDETSNVVNSTFDEDFLQKNY